MAAKAVQEHRAETQEALNAERTALRKDESASSLTLMNVIAKMGMAAQNNSFKMGMAAQCSSSPGGSPAGLYLHDNSLEPDLLPNPGA